VTVPQHFTNVELNNGISTGELDLKSSWAYGIKVGHYFDAIRWLGVETELFNTTPHSKQQTRECSLLGAVPVRCEFVGQHNRVLTWALNWVARYPGERIQPYAGSGLGIFCARLGPEREGSYSSVQPGLNTQVGVRVFLTKQIALFTE